MKRTADKLDFTGWGHTNKSRRLKFNATRSKARSQCLAGLCCGPLFITERFNTISKLTSLAALSKESRFEELAACKQSLRRNNQTIL